jgi:hypothetical protein
MKLHKLIARDFITLYLSDPSKWFPGNGFLSGGGTFFSSYQGQPLGSIVRDESDF